MKYVCCAVSDFLRLRVPLTVPPLATVKDSALGVNWMFCASADDPPVPKSQNHRVSIKAVSNPFARRATSRAGC
jgi:hypothetical protein